MIVFGSPPHWERWLLHSFSACPAILSLLWVYRRAGWLLYCLLEPVLNATEATFCFCTGDIPVADGAVRKMSGNDISDIRNYPLVPGAGIYWSAFYMVTDQLAEAGEPVSLL